MALTELLLVVCLALVAPADAACTTSSVAELVYKVRTYLLLPCSLAPYANPAFLPAARRSCGRSPGGRQPGDAA